MKCNYCGAQLSKDETFCHSCGKPTQVQNTPPFQSPIQQTVIVQSPQPVPSNGAATAGLVLGIIAFVTQVTLVLNFLGVIFSLIGLIKSFKLGGVGRGKSIAGLILSTITVIIGIVLIVVIIGALGAFAASSAASVSIL